MFDGSFLFDAIGQIWRLWLLLAPFQSESGWKGPTGIARAIIALAHGLGIIVVAEGIETEEQRLFLAGERCDQAQGFLLARPMAPATVTRLLDQPPRLGRAVSAPGSDEGSRLVEEGGHR